MTSVNLRPNMTMSSVNFKQNPVTRGESLRSADLAGDAVDFSAKKSAEPPVISKVQLFTGMLDKSQIDQINKSGKLPDNAKFVANGFGSYEISNNFFNFRAGTRELPVGYEVKQNIFGQAIVVAKGTTGRFIK